MHRRWLRRKVRNRVVVYTVEEHTLDGWMTDSASDGIVLIDTRVRSDNDVHLQGDVFIPREKIRMIQVVSARD